MAPPALRAPERQPAPERTPSHARGYHVSAWERGAAVRAGSHADTMCRARASTRTRGFARRRGQGGRIPETSRGDRVAEKSVALSDGGGRDRVRVAKPSERAAPGEASQATWVGLREAAERAGVSVAWLRKEYRLRGLPTRERRGRRGVEKEVPLEEVLHRAARFVRPAPSGAVIAVAEMTRLLDRLAEAERRAIRAELALEQERARTDQLRAEIEQMKGREVDLVAELEELWAERERLLLDARRLRVDAADP